MDSCIPRFRIRAGKFGAAWIRVVNLCEVSISPRKAARKAARKVACVFLNLSLALSLLFPSASSARDRSQAYRKQTFRVYDRDYNGTVNFTDPNPVVRTPARENVENSYTLYQLNSEHYWRFNDHWSLLVDVPYVWYDTTSFNAANNPGNFQRTDSSPSGIRDIIVTPIYWLEDPDAPGGGQFLRAQFRLNVGDKRLSPDEQTALNTVREGGLGYFYAAHQIGGAVQSLFSEGFNFTIDQNWSWKMKKHKFFDLAAAYTYSGSYDPLADLPTTYNPHDRIDLQGMIRERVGGKRQYSYGARLRLYSNAKINNPRSDSLATSPSPPTGSAFTPTGFIAGTVTDLDHDTDYDLIWDMSTIHSKRSASSVSVTYTQPGNLDLMTARGNVVRDIRPGDAVFARYTRSYKQPGGMILTGGLSSGRINESSVGGVNPPDTDRNMLALVLGASHRYQSGHAWSTKVDVGLAADSANLVGNLVYQFAW